MFGSRTRRRFIQQSGMLVATPYLAAALHKRRKGRRPTRRFSTTASPCHRNGRHGNDGTHARAHDGAVPAHDTRRYSHQRRLSVVR